MSELVVKVKHHALEFQEQILKIMNQFGAKMREKVLPLNEELFRIFYGRFDAPSNPRFRFYPLMAQDCIGKNVRLCIYLGDINRFQEAKNIARTQFDPLIAQMPNDFNYKRNCVHTSENEETAIVEVAAVIPYIG